ncbi:SIMPL domain-containing protein [Halorussus halobius]|uniref:SIMPL domain-containing protein n=1 Tax=Halorussus halobius TaxID=1710537 RepID=UPI0010929D02|nr:SIMPL domain-containing protein [Halorussus halobius]
MRRGTLATVGLALLVVTAGCVGTIGPTDEAGAQQSSDAGTVSVAATGQAAAEPDQALVQVAVVASADDAETVRESLAANASRMREALAAAGVGDDAIRTASYSIDQRYVERGGDRVAEGVEGRHAFELTLSDVDAVGAVVDAAVSNGADRVERVELTLSEERRRAVRADALRDAMANARGNADVVAESANLTVTGVHSASTGDLNFEPIRAQALETDDAGPNAGARTSVESGPVTVTAQVDVTYNATG